MTDSIITVEEVSKRYRLGSGYGAEAGIAHKLDSAMRAPFRLLSGKRAVEPEGEEFWALKDISFDVEPGEMFGLIGANGAGKSTLLKLLAQISAPTEGRITIHGKVGSLLEVGTGFHPELTGRENVFLSGAILGMRRSQIAEKYDEIVEFAGIQEFMETPVKRYSSGMFVRLGFAVASHLRPNILLVDEVLAVGDAVFQRKCLDKMQEITHEAGTTIIFVTHNSSWVRKVCDRAIYLESGRIAREGRASKVVDEYLEHIEPVKHGGVAIIPPDARRIGTGQATLTRAALSATAGEPTDRVGFGEPFRITATFEVGREVPDAMVIVGVDTLENSRVTTNYSTENGEAPMHLKPGTFEVSALVDVTLLPGEYVVWVSVTDSRGAAIDSVERVLTFTALNVPVDADRDRYPWDSARGAVKPSCTWEIESSSTALSTAGEREPAISQTVRSQADASP